MKSRGLSKIFVVVLSLILVFTGLSSVVKVDYAYADSTGTVNLDPGDTLNVRTGPGTSYDRIGVLYPNDKVTIIGTESGWYKINYGEGYGYVSGDYVTVSNSGSSSGSGNNSGSGTTTNNFESSIASFPDSYKPYLRALHEKYPNWVFKAKNTNLNWNDVIAKETENVSTNLVPESWDSSYKSKSSAAFSSAGDWIIFDSGGYVAASVAAVKYYMDPRNFINENSIFQFYSNSYDPSTQTLAGINTIISGSFMSKPFPEETFPSYAHLFMEAGKQSATNPLALASMVLQEQGYQGASPLISGTVPGFEGIYNFFNVGAYAAGGNSAVTNGLISARARGWNSRTKSIIEGSKYVGNNYTLTGQNTLYLKKFNVMNGLANVGTHQYMTAVYGANSEGIHLKTGYKNLLNYPLIFEIPVYYNMPSSPCPVPTSAGTGAEEIESGGENSGGNSGSENESSGGNSGSGNEGSGGNSGSGNESSGGNSETTPKPTPTILATRVAGSDRVKTSLEAADKLKSTLGVSKFMNIVVASGTSYADALSGTYLATVKKAPVILVTGSSIAETANYIKNNIYTSGTVYIVGGSSAVPGNFENALGNIKTVRLAGANRYETNLLALAECKVRTGDILVCSGENYPDALSASAVGKPIVLVGKTLSPNQQVFLSSISGSRFYVIGGTGVINDNLFNVINSYGKAVRVSGKDRYGTSLKVANTFFTGTQKNAVIAYGGNYPDGISSGPLAATLKAPILLVNSKDYNSAKVFLDSSKVKNIFVMGGNSVISQTVVDALSR